MTRLSLYTFVLFLLLGLSLPCISQKLHVDSIMHEAEQYTGEERLKFILKSHTLLRGSQELLTLAEVLEAEAEQQENLKYLGYAYQQKALHYLYMLESDSIIYYASLAKKAFIKIDDQKGIQYVDFTLTPWYITQGNHELAIYTMQSFLDRNSDQTDSRSISAAYNNLGTAYYNASLPKEAIKAHKQALAILETEENPQETVKMFTYLMLIHDFNRNKEYDKALQYCNILNENLNAIKNDNISSLINYWKFFISYSYACIYLDQKDLVKAMSFLAEAESDFSDDMYDSDKNLLENLKAEYFLEIKKYNLALKHTDKIINNSKEKHPFQYMKLMEFRAKILSLMGQTGEAYQTMSYLSEYRDSLANKNMTVQLAEMQTIYQTGELKAQVESEKAKSEFTTKISIASVLIALLSLSLAILIRRNALIQSRKDKILFEQLKSNDANALYLRGLNERQTESLSSELKLFNAINAFVESSEYFKNSDVSRDFLATELGTNRQYIATAIKEGTGKTFSDYINDLRLDYCRHRILDNKEKSIEEIFTEAGFISRSTFNRQFLSKYGMSPKKLLELSLEFEKITLKN